MQKKREGGGVQSSAGMTVGVVVSSSCPSWGMISRTPLENLTLLLSVSLSSILILRSSDLGAKSGDMGVRGSRAGSRSRIPCSWTKSLLLYSSCNDNEHQRTPTEMFLPQTFMGGEG